MTKLPSKEFCDGVRAMSDKTLLAAYRRHNKKFEALEKERMRCWNRFMEINDIEDVLGGERQMLTVEIRFNRKLKVS
jgi:siroheme synthase (precorrin-2 oxidase/ferrochelatase)